MVFGFMESNYSFSDQSVAFAVFQRDNISGMKGRVVRQNGFSLLRTHPGDTSEVS